MTKKVALITGCARRIGKHIATHLAQDGWDIAIHYNRSEEDAKKLAETIKTLGRKTVLIRADLTNLEDTVSILPKASHTLGPVSCLINNASLFANDTIETFSSPFFEEMQKVNLHAPLLLIHHFAKQLPAGIPGYIINMLDYCVWNFPNAFLSYTLSKTALWTATQTLALQLAPHIRVNGIGLGLSLKNDRETEERFKKTRAIAPLGNSGGLDEISRAIDFILHSPSFTGQMLALDGGKHLLGAPFYL